MLAQCLGGWGLVHVGAVPVPYDRQFRCAFPQIAEAVLHTVPPAASSLGSPGRDAEAGGANGAYEMAMRDRQRRYHAEHGNGTQRMFLEDDTVMFASLHRYDGGSFYPGGADGAVTQLKTAAWQFSSYLQNFCDRIAVPFHHMHLAN